MDDPEDEGNLHLVAVEEHDAVGGPKPHRVHPHWVRLPSVHCWYILFIDDNEKSKIEECDLKATPAI